MRLTILGRVTHQHRDLVAGMRDALAAMERHGVPRIANLSGAGIAAPGERKPPLD